MNYKVGEIAKKVGINVETFRYYERLKLLPKPRRMESGYRLYDDSDLKRLLFIKSAKSLGFTLKEIKELLELKVDSLGTCGDVKEMAEQRLEDIQQRIHNLQQMETALLQIIQQCVDEKTSTTECPIIELINYGGQDEIF